MKIGVVGCGQVGAASAYACVLQGVGTELVLCDKFPDYAVAQAEDILHATPFAASMPVRAGGFDDLAGAGIVMIAAGLPQKDASESRLDLLRRNADLFGEIIPQILKAAPNAVLMIASNPVDVMTHISAQIAKDTCGHESSRVIGSGTILDTARFRAAIASHLGVSAHSVHGYVLGEHGDSEVLHWSGMTVGNMPLVDFAAQVQAPVTAAIRARIDEDVRCAAYRIIKGKGATWFGIGAGMARLAQAVIGDQRAVITCCTPDESENVTLSLPRIIANTGVTHTMAPLLSCEEQLAFNRSKEILQEAIKKVLK